MCHNFWRKLTFVALSKFVETPRNERVALEYSKEFDCEKHAILL